MSKTKSEFQQCIAQGPRTDLSAQFAKASSVALILCEGPSPELLFIKRAINPHDNWSGQVAFPGGKKDEGDASLLDACLREVREEVGLDLDKLQCLGALDDMQARRKGLTVDFFVRPFVFFLETKPELKLNPGEVDAVQWIPLDYLFSETNKTAYAFEREGLKMSLPAVAFPNGDILWGMTYMMLQNFYLKLGRAIRQ